jgi:hypothetical protein
MTPAVVTFIGVWLNGVLYTEMPAVSSLTVAAAPFAAWSGETRWARSGPRRRLLVAALAVALLLAVALAGAIAESLRTAASDPYYH